MSDTGGSPPPPSSPFEQSSGSTYGRPGGPGAGPTRPAPPTPPPGPAGDEEPSKPSGDVPGWVLLVAAGVVLAMIGALAFAVLHGGGTKAPLAAPPEQPYPQKWDKRIAPYAKIASRLRGLDFRHPVAVRFLSPAAFTKSLAADDGTSTKQDRQDAEQAVAVLRALGLVSGQPDLVAATRSFGRSAVLAYYSFKTTSITVRGTTITPAMRSTLVHELTHVLQDQNFSVGDELKRLQNREAKRHQGEAAEVLDAIVEGDAERIEGLYRASLPAAQQRALDRAQAAAARAATRQLKKLPKIITTFLTSPYTLGIGLVRTADEDGDNGAVDKLLQFPPEHSSALLDPLRAITDTVGGSPVPTTSLGPGEKKFESGEFGALTWYLMLAAHLPPVQALTAADGWAGDSYVAFHRGGTTCERMTFAGRTSADSARMLNALRTWATKAPGTHARATLAGGQVVFESCDPGQRVHGGSDSSDRAVALVVIRTQLVDTFLHSGTGIPAARCLSEKLIQAFTVAQLSDPRFGQNDPGVTRRVQQMASSCQSP